MTDKFPIGIQGFEGLRHDQYLYVDKFHTSLGPVLEYIRVSRDKKKLDELLQKDPRYSRMERESADLINTATNSELTYSEEGD